MFKFWRWKWFNRFIWKPLGHIFRIRTAVQLLTGSTAISALVAVRQWFTHYWDIASLVLTFVASLVVLGIISIRRSSASENTRRQEQLSLMGPSSTSLQAGLSPMTEENISIAIPVTGPVLIDKKPLGNSHTYAIRGKLKQLPPGCHIWLVTAGIESEQYWPQTSYDVQHNDRTGNWNGRVHTGGGPVRIIALVAPPTTQQFFLYYKQVGDATKNYTPLRRIPAECLNVCEIQVDSNLCAVTPLRSQAAELPD
jgi:hypothetical protein